MNTGATPVMTAQPARASRDRAASAAIEERVFERLRRAEWHQFRPLKVFRVDGEWVMAFRIRASPAIAYAIHPTQQAAFDDAETIAQAIREEYPCGRA